MGIHHIRNVLQFGGGDTKEIRIEVLSEGGKGIVEAYRPVFLNFCETAAR